MNQCVTVGLLALILIATFAHGSPMMYKKNDQSNYEAGEVVQLFNGISCTKYDHPLDLVPVSSTVIPLNVYEVSYGSKDGKLNEDEYKRIYMKNMPKKAHKHHQPGILDKLVTGGWNDGRMVGVILTNEYSFQLNRDPRRNKRIMVFMRVNKETDLDWMICVLLLVRVVGSAGDLGHFWDLRTIG